MAALQGHVMLNSKGQTPTCTKVVTKAAVPFLLPNPASLSSTSHSLLCGSLCPLHAEMADGAMIGQSSSPALCRELQHQSRQEQQHSNSICLFKPSFISSLLSGPSPIAHSSHIPLSSCFPPIPSPPGNPPLATTVLICKHFPFFV